MDPKISVNKFNKIVKIGFITLALTISTSGYAEYYLVNSGPDAGCCAGPSMGCCPSPRPSCDCCPCGYGFRFVSHYRHYVTGSGQSEEYEWYGDP